MCFTQWEARRTVIPPPGPEAPKMLRENSLLFTGILGREPAFSQEEKGEGNISERGCARDHSERV